MEFMLIVKASKHSEAESQPSRELIEAMSQFNEEFPDSISGFILLDVNSREEAVEWAKRMPDPIGYGEGVVDLRQVYEGEVQTEIPETSYE